MNKSAFPRIARHMNYRRSYPTPTTSRVDIPGFPYEAFDNTGTKIKPWSLLRLFESVRAFTFWENVTKDSPERSMVDMHLILQNHFVFIIGANVDIQKELHSVELPKYPLYVLTSLTQVGKSSKTLSYELRHSGTDMLYAKCDVSDVLVSTTSRKPVTYPDWWLQKYGGTPSDQKASLLNVSVPENGLVSSSVKVSSSDTDTYRHTNWTAYVKFCYESLHQHVESKKYKNISPAIMDAGIKSFNMSYKEESNVGDELTVQSWEEVKEPNRVNFSISKGESLCFQSTIQFHSSNQSKL